ncbi:MAG: DegT/DnrJ/EryC1/StrS family aminotransferase [Verrucomicrobiaceae bacterium]|nr:DegT/DnrJ/EryC1/StrS family aminotransferase [Verrucomicrobiaceae bacterium]
MTSPLHRRRFISAAATTGAAAFLTRTTAAEKSVAKTPMAKASAEWPLWDASEETALLDALHSGKWGRTSRGRHLLAFETAFARQMRAKHCIAVSSGTTALLTALGALGIGPGDEVILSTYTFVATFNAITNSYALPRFVDSDAATFQIDPTKIAAAITPQTRLLLPVHIGGSPADMTAINAVGKARSIPVIEDACQAPLAELDGQPVGTIGLGGCFSFQASKNMTAGEGGAVLTNDEAFANLCFNFHTPGGGKPGPSLGRGANYRLTEFQAALLTTQLVRLIEHAKRRDANAAYLTEMLRKVPGITPARLVPGCTRSGWHLYMLRYDSQQFAGLSRARFLEELSKAGISASSGYTSLNRMRHVQALATNPHYLRLYGKETMTRWADVNQCPVNDKLCEEAVWFSQTKLLGTRAEMERVVEAAASIQKRAGDLQRNEKTARGA